MNVKGKQSLSLNNKLTMTLQIQLAIKLLQLNSVDLQKEIDEKTKKLTLYCEDDVIYDDLAQVLEAIKTRREEDPELFFIDDKSGIRLPSKNVLFAQVVMGSVML